MTWVSRFGEVARNLALVFLQVGKLVTEATETLAMHLDAVCDDLIAKLQPGADPKA